MPNFTVDSEEPIVVLKLSEYESLIETLEILSEESSIFEKIEKARVEMVKGEAVSADKFFKLLKK